MNSKSRTDEKLRAVRRYLSRAGADRLGNSNRLVAELVSAKTGVEISRETVRRARSQLVREQKIVHAPLRLDARGRLQKCGRRQNRFVKPPEVLEAAPTTATSEPAAGAQTPDPLVANGEAIPPEVAVLKTELLRFAKEIDTALCDARKACSFLDRRDRWVEWYPLLSRLNSVYDLFQRLRAKGHPGTDCLACAGAGCPGCRGVGNLPK